MPRPAFRSASARYSTSAVTSIAPWPPGTRTQCWSANEIFSGGSSKRDATINGRRPSRSDRSATRAARFADRVDENVAKASTSVPPAVANDEIVTQSGMRRTLVNRPDERPLGQMNQPARSLRRDDTATRAGPAHPPYSRKCPSKQQMSRQIEEQEMADHSRRAFIRGAGVTA